MKKNKVEEFTLSNIKTLIIKYSLIETVVLAQDVQTYWWNRTVGLGNRPSLQDQIIYEKGATEMQWGKDNIFSNLYFIMKLYPISKHAHNSIWFIDLDVKEKTIKFLESIIDYVFNIGVSRIIS